MTTPDAENPRADAVARKLAVATDIGRLLGEDERREARRVLAIHSGLVRYWLRCTRYFLALPVGVVGMVVGLVGILTGNVSPVWSVATLTGGGVISVTVAVLLWHACLSALDVAVGMYLAADIPLPPVPPPPP